jgi:hypothetical protein
MRTKPDETQNTTAVERWLKKRTQDHFAKRISTPELLAEPVQTLLKEALLTGECLQWMIELPSQGILHRQRREGLFRRMLPRWELTPGWLIALTNQRLLMARTLVNEKDPRMSAIPVEKIVYLEQGMVLLFSWLEIHWVENGTVAQETFYYNSVDDQIFITFLQMLRQAMATIHTSTESRINFMPDAANISEVKYKRDDPPGRSFLERLPLKFKNLIPHYGLRKEEPIFQGIYRPAQWGKLFRIARVMTDPRMALLETDAYLLMMTEPIAKEEGDYGFTLTFLPRKFVRASIPGGTGPSCCLKIHLTTQQASRDWSLSFPTGMEEEVRDFARQINGDLTPPPPPPLLP